MVPNKSFELRTCSKYRKSNYRESTEYAIEAGKIKLFLLPSNLESP